MRNLLYLLPLALVLTLASCNTAARATTAKADMAEKEMAAKAPSYAGAWSVTVEDTPLGTVTGKLMLEEGENGLKGNFITPDGKSLPLRKTTTTADGMSTSFYFPDYDVDVDVNLKGKPTDAMLVGQSMGQFNTTAKRL